MTYYEVTDSYGDVYTADGEDFDNDSWHLFKNGQCLAFAQELAKEINSDQLVATFHEGVFCHIFVKDNLGLLWDVNGLAYDDLNFFTCETLSIKAADRLLTLVPQQNYDYAKAQIPLYLSDMKIMYSEDVDEDFADYAESSILCSA